MKINNNDCNLKCAYNNFFKYAMIEFTQNNVVLYVHS